MNYYMAVLKKYAVFTGRAERAEYWYFVLFNIIVSLILSKVTQIMFGYAISMLFSVAYGLAVLLPGLGVSIRRLHDIGKSGWFLLISFIPLIGVIWLIVLMATQGNPGTNAYGPSPKGTPSSASTPAV